MLGLIGAAEPLQDRESPGLVTNVSKMHLVLPFQEQQSERHLTKKSGNIMKYIYLCGNHGLVGSGCTTYVCISYMFPTSRPFGLKAREGAQLNFFIPPAPYPTARRIGNRVKGLGGGSQASNSRHEFVDLRAFNWSSRWT